MHRRRPEPVPNYTDAFLVTVWGILFMGFWVLGALGGLLWVALFALGLNRLITYIARRMPR